MSEVWKGWAVISNISETIVHAQETRKDLMLNWWHNNSSLAARSEVDDHYKGSRIAYKQAMRDGYIKLIRVEERWSVIEILEDLQTRYNLKGMHKEYDAIRIAINELNERRCS